MVQLIERSLIDKTAELAGQSRRRRINHNFHAGPQDNPHRFLNVLLKGTYIRPHRHLDPPKSETFLVLEGRAEVLLFDDDGRITARHPIGSDCDTLGVDLSPGIWHTVIALSDRVVCFEVKPGPWVPATDKEFADWAPAENDASVERYLAGLMP